MARSKTKYSKIYKKEKQNKTIQAKNKTKRKKHVHRKKKCKKCQDFRTTYTNL